MKTEKPKREKWILPMLQIATLRRGEKLYPADWQYLGEAQEVWRREQKRLREEYGEERFLSPAIPSSDFKEVVIEFDSEGNFGRLVGSERKGRCRCPGKKTLQAQVEECGTPSAVHARFYKGRASRSTVYEWYDRYGLKWETNKDELMNRRAKRR